MILHRAHSPCLALVVLFVCRCSPSSATASQPSSLASAANLDAGDDAAEPTTESTSSASGASRDAAPDARLPPPPSHRAAAQSCTPSVGQGPFDPSSGEWVSFECSTDSDCPQPFGLCVYAQTMMGGRGGPVCVSTCSNDADCGSQQVSSFGRAGFVTLEGVCGCYQGYYGLNACGYGNCRIDADCAPGELCTQSDPAPNQAQGFQGFPGNHAMGLFCTSPADTCVPGAGGAPCGWSDVTSSFQPYQ